MDISSSRLSCTSFSAQALVYNPTSNTPTEDAAPPRASHDESAIQNDNTGHLDPVAGHATFDHWQRDAHFTSSSSMDVALLPKGYNELKQRCAREEVLENRDLVSYLDQFLILQPFSFLNPDHPYGDAKALRAVSKKMKEGVDRAVKIRLKRVDVHATDPSGQTPLITASLYNQLKSVRLFLNQNANVNAQDSYGRTALIHASKNNCRNVVRVLLDHNADVNVRGSFGETALIEASRRNHPEIVRMLLDQKANVNARNSCGNSALTYARVWGHLSIIEMLSEHNAYARSGGMPVERQPMSRPSTET